MQVIQEKYGLNNLDKCVQKMFLQVNWMPIIIRKNEIGSQQSIGNHRWFCFFCVIFQSNFFYVFIETAVGNFFGKIAFLNIFNSNSKKFCLFAESQRNTSDEFLFGKIPVKQPVNLLSTQLQFWWLLGTMPRS